MCGLAGLVWKDRERPADLERVRRMNAELVHRGPDDDGVHGHGPVALAHRRLSILDLSAAGHQPMLSADGTLVLVFNGEIYNYLELREELRGLGHAFHTDCDTEVLLAAYRQWGPGCVERLVGMWAFAIHDIEAGQVVLSRDRFGIKPLFYADRPDCLGFASEAKALLAVWPDERRANLAAIRHFLPSGLLCDGPETFFAGILTVPPAHNAILDLASGRLRLLRYWDIDPARRIADAESTGVERLREQLNESIALHLRSDVPVGTCLSGGIDSSGIVCLSAARRGTPIHTFSGLYEDPGCDESQYVDAVNQHALTVPSPVRPRPAGDLLADLTTIGWHQDMPSAGPGLYTQFHVMRRAAREVKVMLDGQGADELFGGYIPYFGARLGDVLRTGGPGGAFGAIATAGVIAKHWGWASLAAVGAQLSPLVATAFALATRLRLGGAYRVATPIHPALETAVGDGAIERRWPSRFDRRLDDALYWDVASRSLPALLHYEDRNSMAYSIEARVPFLDHRVVELAFALPGSMKMRGSWTKWALRKSLSGVVPDSVAWRRSKLGYPTPFGRWAREAPDRDDLHDVLFSASAREREIIDLEALKRVWDIHQSGAGDHGWLLWRCASLELWFRQFIDGFVPSPAVPRDAHGQAL